MKAFFGVAASEGYVEQIRDAPRFFLRGKLAVSSRCRDLCHERGWKISPKVLGRDKERMGNKRFASLCSADRVSTSKGGMVGISLCFTKRS